MTTHDRDKVIAAAREARISKTWNSPEWYIVFERFYAIAFEAGRVAEREECAKVCEKNLHSWDGTSDRNDDYRSAHIRDIVDIRVRSTK